MKAFVRIVAIAAAAVAVLAFRSDASLRASLLSVLAAALWIASSRPVQRPPLLLLGTFAAALILVGTLFGPFGLVIFDVVNARP